MAIKLFWKNKKAITALKLIPLVLIIYTCEERTFNNPFDTGVELNPDDWAPTNLTIEILSDSDVRLTWQNSKTNITVYKIERKISTGGSFVEVDSSDTTIYTDTGLITGNEYIYQVCAYAGDQKSSYISSDTIMTVFPAPYNFIAESLSSGIVLTWDDSTAFEESFQVERKSISSNAYTILDSTQANTYLDSVIVLGNQYIYRVSAFSNYNSTSYTETVVVKYWQDCLDVWGGDAEEDNCGTCDNDSSNDCNMDCAGVENGPAVEDCSGECGGTAVEDECGVCNGSGSPENYDCSGNCTANVDCSGECGGSAVEDECGVCDGYGTTCSAPITDIDGNIYETVQIGDQVWMAENLKTTKYKDGSAISTGYTDSEWADLVITETGAYGVYDDDPANADIYGYLYNWFASKDDNLCMEGWHVPTDDEYKQLEMYLGMSEEDANLSSWTDRGTNEGSKLAGRSDLWKDPVGSVWNDTIDVNEEFGTSGFNALPGGYRAWQSGAFNYTIGQSAFFWTSSKYDALEYNEYGTSAWKRALDNRYIEIFRTYQYKQYGGSVRCIKGEMPDCNGVPGGSAIIDCQGICGGDSVEDCSGKCGGTATECVYDVDGNGYTTVTIGTQEWLVQNLKTTKYKDGSEIAPENDVNIYLGYNWNHLNEGASVVYDTSNGGKYSFATFNTYGRLYNWYAVDDSRGICMEGWHVPTDDEWTILSDYLGSNVGGKMKEAGNEHWDSPNTGATNESGFTALPAGYRQGGTYGSMGYSNLIWSSSKKDSYNIWTRGLYSDMAGLERGAIHYLSGLPVRCISDVAIDIDCEGVPGGSASTDNCGTCDSDSSNDCTQDCNGDWGGSAYLDDCNDCIEGNTGLTFNYAKDDCGICNGINSSNTGICDCNGTPNGSATIDNCANCDADTSNDCVQDCAGTWGGGATTDNCGVCDGDLSNDNTPSTGTCDCEGTPNGSVVDDCTGVCGGTHSDDDCGTVTDIDGNLYKTIKIGNQIWMAENLKVTHYRNGNVIPTGLSGPQGGVWGCDGEWACTTSGAYDGQYADTYGNHYNWFTVDDSRDVCPGGWHVPTDNEWTILTNYLGGEEVAGGKMKATGTTWWNMNSGATNESGFTALGAGYYRAGQPFQDARSYGYFWSSTEDNDVTQVGTWAKMRILEFDESYVERYNGYGNNGYSIRCLAD